MLPDVDQQNLAGGQRKERTLPLKVLVLATLSSVGTLDIHDEDVVGHARPGAVGALVLGHPDALCGLLSLGLGHDGELGAEQVVEEGRLARRLGAEDGDQVVVEAGLGDMLALEIFVEAGAVGGGNSLSATANGPDVQTSS